MHLVVALDKGDNAEIGMLMPKVNPEEHMGKLHRKF